MSEYVVDVVVDEAVSDDVTETADLLAWLDRCLRACEDAGASPGSFTVRLTGDPEIAALNASYRGREGATDVLSFEGEQTPEGRHLGDVVISVPTAARQGQAEGHGLACELRVLALHGLLHCLGYDHDRDDGEMDALELSLRERLLPGAN